MSFDVNKYVYKLYRLDVDTMKKINLNEAVDEFDMIDRDTRVFYNNITGEFDYLNDFRIDNDDDFNADKFDFE